MRATRIFCFLLLIATLLFFGPTRSLKAQTVRLEPERRSSSEIARTSLKDHNSSAYSGRESSAESGTGGIREAVDNKYKKRYQVWKDEFLSTEIGRTQWDMFTKNPHLILTVTVSRSNSHGAGSGKYKWSESGELIAATITLGNRIDE